LLREPGAPSSIAVAAKSVAWTSELVDRLKRRRRSNVQTAESANRYAASALATDSYWVLWWTRRSG